MSQVKNPNTTLKKNLEKNQKTDVFVVHPIYGFSPADVSEYYSKAFKSMGYNVFDFYSHRHITYHGLALDNLVRIGAIEKAPDMEEIRSTVYMQLVGALQVIKPEIIFIPHGISIDLWALQDMQDIAERYGCRTVLVTTESPHSKEEELEISQYFDYIFTTDLTGNDYLDAEYIGHSYFEGIHAPIRVYNLPQKFIVDLGFVGSFYPERVKIFQKLINKGYSSYFSGIIRDSDDYISDDFIDRVRPVLVENKDLSKLYTGASFSLNFTRRSIGLNDTEEQDTKQQKSVTIRMVEVMASGGVLVTDETDELKDEFQEGVHYIGFSNADELISKLDYWRTRSEELAEIRMNAYFRVREVKRSYRDNAKHILKVLNYSN